LLIFFGFRAHELDGAAYGGGADGGVELLLGALAEVGEDAGDEVFKNVGATEDLGAGEAADGEVGFEGLDEAAGMVALLVGGEVVGDGVGSGAGEDALAGLLEEEDGAGAWGLLRPEAGEFDALWRNPCDAAVGGAEVDADGWQRA
jgi:hypothetical protein